MLEYGPPDLSVVIPTRRRPVVLSRTLEALRAQSVAGFEVVVVVDGTDQPPPDASGVRVLTQEHAGPGAARNTGTAASDRALVLFLGDDMIPTSDLVARHLERHCAHPEPEVAVLGRSVWHPEVARSRIHRWMDWSSTQFDYRNIQGEEAGFGRFYSSNVSLKRAFFLCAGGFDPDFVFYYEDLDCGWRLHQRGMRLLYEPRAVARHLHRTALGDLVRRFEGVARGELLMARKHPWFTPYFRERAERARERPSVSRVWPLIVDAVPRRLGRLRGAAERRADRWYYQRLAPHFLDAWEGERDREDLREYLGDNFDEARLREHLHEVRRELETVGDETTFYRTSRSYLYDLTAFANWGTKVPYRLDLRRLAPPPARLLDWGCGIGADGLRFVEEGYEVAFADFDNPSTRYLRWRLERRGIDARVYDIERDEIPGGFDVVYAFDVIEHVPDPIAFLAELERHATLVIVNLLESEPDDLHPHHELPIDSILERATDRGLVRYRVYHGRSHLLAYRGTGAIRTPRLRSVGERKLGRLLAAVGR